MVKKIAVIGGSGLESLALGQINEHVSNENGRPFQYYLTQVEGVEVVFFPRHGVDHQNLPLDVPYIDMFRIFESERVETILSFSATGTLDHRVPLADKKSFVVPHDFIRGYGFQPVSARREDNPHADMSEPFHPVLRTLIIDTGRGLGYTMGNKGIYILNEGNGFETKAEIALLNVGLRYTLLVSVLGQIVGKLSKANCDLQLDELKGDLYQLGFPGVHHLDFVGAQVGMTAPKEAILAAEYKIPYGLVACPVNIAEGMSTKKLGHDKTMQVINDSKPYIKELAFGVIGKLKAVVF